MTNILADIDSIIETNNNESLLEVEMELSDIHLPDYGDPIENGISESTHTTHNLNSKTQDTLEDTEEEVDTFDFSDEDINIDLDEEVNQSSIKQMISEVENENERAYLELLHDKLDEQDLSSNSPMSDL